MKVISGAALAAMIAACSTDMPQANDEKTANGAAEAAVAAEWPAGLTVGGDGYPQSGNACRRVGESAAASGWLDDSADLVGCPTVAEAEALGGRIVDANSGMGETGPN